MNSVSGTNDKNRKLATLSTKESELDTIQQFKPYDPSTGQKSME